MHLFFVPHITANSHLITLPEDEAKHFKVLRLTEKDNIFITNGKGIKCKVKVKEKNKKSILLEIKEIETFQAEKQKIQIAIAPTKGNDRFEWFIEKAVEIGVTDIYPFYSEFSERKRINLNRLNKIMISALKQSMRVFIPNIMPIQSFKEIIALPELKHSISYIAHCKKDNLPLLKNKTLKHDTCIMIGPEGGFSTKEITMATNAGWQEVSLGQYRFRTETSGIAAALTVKIIQE